MAGATRWLRARAFASSWFEVLVLVLVVCAAAGAYATGTAYAAPGTTQQRESVQEWAVTDEFEHAATVTRENPVFETGTVLRDRSRYFTGVSPTLDVTYAATYRDVGGDSGPLSVTLDAALVARSVTEAGDVVWRDRRPLASASRSLSSGETASVSVPVNVTQLRERVQSIQAALGDSTGSVQTFLAVNVTASGAAGGATRKLSYARRLSLTAGEGSYGVSTPGGDPQVVSTTRVVAVPKAYGALWTAGGPVLLVLGALGLAALALAARRDALALSAAERDYLAFRDDRAEFDEWVVRARLPESVRARERADAATLADLVDFAIDADVGVVEDTETGAFYAVTQDLLVAFDPPDLDADPSPLAGFGLGVPGDTASTAAESTASEVDDERVLDLSGDAPDTESGDGSTGEAGADDSVETDAGDGEDDAGDSEGDGRDGEAADARPAEE